MGGGLMQLVAYGAQDIYLTGNPQITFFKVVYRRHTNFSMESIEQTINGTSTLTASSTSGTVTISRNGDLVGKIYVTSSTAGITNGSALVSEVELEIGGQRIDKHYQEWNEIWNELSTPESKAVAMKAMTGSVGSSGTTGVGMVQVPLNFWFCRNPGLALPLIALQYHEVKLKFTWGTDSTTGATGAACKVMVDYIYLDTDERRRFAQQSHEYLIEQLQRQNESGSTSMKLNFNHPVKELIWTSNADYGDAKLVLNGHDRFSKQEEEYFQLRQPMDHHTAVPRHNIPNVGTPVLLATPISFVSETEVDAAVAGNAAAGAAGKISVTAAGVVTFMTVTNPGTIYVGDVISLAYPSTAGQNTNHLVTVTAVAAQWVDDSTAVSITVNQTGDNLSVSAAGDGAGYIVARTQTNLCRTSQLTAKVNVYSFALKPEEHQPSGTCNFSRIDNAKLNFDVNPHSGTMNVYAVNYNVLRIMSGMGGLAYSN